MSALLVGYARCSTDQEDLTAQHGALLSVGVEAERIYVDRGLTGTNRERPGVRCEVVKPRQSCSPVVLSIDGGSRPSQATCSASRQTITHASAWARIGRSTDAAVVVTAGGWGQFDR